MSFRQAGMSVVFCFVLWSVATAQEEQNVPPRPIDMALDSDKPEEIKFAATAQIRLFEGKRTGQLVVTVDLKNDWSIYSVTQRPPFRPTKIRVPEGGPLRITGSFRPDKKAAVVFIDFMNANQEYHADKVQWAAPILVSDRLALGDQVTVSLDAVLFTDQSSFPVRRHPIKALVVAASQNAQTELLTANKPAATEHFAMAAGPGKRFALVIGNTDYEGSKRLRNPGNDADLIGKTLHDLNFEVTTHKNLKLPQLEDAILAFRKSLTENSLALFYFAGHGIQSQGVNYLVPVGARIREEFEVKRQCLDLGYVLEGLQSTGKKHLNVVVLDCCRDNPYKRSWTTGQRNIKQGLARVAVSEGTLIAFATSPGQTADDGRAGNSPYAKQLANVFNQRPQFGLELVRAFRNASQAVKKETGQIPWLNMEASLDDYYLLSANRWVLSPRNETVARLINGRQQWQMNAPTGRFLTVAPNSQSLCVGSNKRVSCYNALNGELHWTQRLEFEPRQVVYSADSEHVIVHGDRPQQRITLTVDAGREVEK